MIDIPKTASELTARLREDIERCPCCRLVSDIRLRGQHPNAVGKSLTFKFEAACNACGYVWTEAFRFEQAAADRNQELMTYVVEYQIWSLATQELLARGSIEVEAFGTSAARHIASVQIPEKDPHFDDRVQPHLRLLSCKLKPRTLEE